MRRTEYAKRVEKLHTLPPRFTGTADVVPPAPQKINMKSE